MSLIYSIIETAAHPNFSVLYRQHGMEEQRFTNMRKAMAALKKRVPDYIVAEFIYGYSNNYAGVNISNLDVLLYSLQKYAPDCRVIVFCNKGEEEYTDKLQAIFPLHAVLTKPVQPADLQAAIRP
jgi:two-component SAPR family response regulator